MSFSVRPSTALVGSSKTMSFGVADQRTCDGETLLLSARQGAPTFTHEGLVTGGHPDHVLVQVRRLRRFDDLILVEIPEEPDVVHDRALQQYRFLGHERHRVVGISSWKSSPRPRHQSSPDRPLARADPAGSG